MKPVHRSKTSGFRSQLVAMSLVLLVAGFSALGVLVSCGRHAEPADASHLQSSITLNKSRGLRPEVMAAFQKILVDAGAQGEADIPMPEILKLFRMSDEQLDVVRGNWLTPAHVVCDGWVCRLRATGTAVSVPASKEVWLPLVGYPQVKIADEFEMKFRHMNDDKTIEFCSISGVSITGFSLLGAVMVVDGDESTFTPFFSPSWTYPSRACDF